MSDRYDKVRARLDAIGDRLSRGGLTTADRENLRAEERRLEDEFDQLARAGLVASAATVTEFLAGEVHRHP